MNSAIRVKMKDIDIKSNNSFKENIDSVWVEDVDGNILLNLCYICVYNSEGSVEYKIKLPINVNTCKLLVNNGDLGCSIFGFRDGRLDSNAILELDTLKYSYELVCGDIEPVKLQTGIKVVALNTINKILTTKYNKDGKSYDVNRMLLKSYLSIVSMSLRNREFTMEDFNESIRLFFSSTMTLQDDRDDKSRRKFTGIYMVDNRYYNRDRNKYKDTYTIIISDNPARFASLIGMSILDNIYFKIDFLKGDDSIRYYDKYNAFMKLFKKEDKRNIKATLDMLSVRCIKGAYTDNVDFIEEVVNGEF